MIDYLIIGQGISGTNLHFQLKKTGCSIRVIDKGNENSASAIAAGIVNPVTGKRFVKSWKFETLDLYARSQYSEMEAHFANKYIINAPILRALRNPAMINSWDSKIGRKDYQKYLTEDADLGNYSDILKGDMIFGETYSSYRIRTSVLLQDYRGYLRQINELLESEFREENLRVGKEYHQYEGKKYKHIIYANGHAASKSKFWNYLPFNLSKGEALKVKGLDKPFDKILKYLLFVVPLTDGNFWIGSSNNWDFTDNKPEKQARNYLETRLSEFISPELKTIDHLAGIRPTVDDRRPLIGTHPKYSKIHLFNGMGTKGVSLSPYLAHQMKNHLIKGSEFDDSVNISRFESDYR